jgi:hypothetical protein
LSEPLCLESLAQLKPLNPTKSPLDFPGD